MFYLQELDWVLPTNVGEESPGASSRVKKRELFSNTPELWVLLILWVLWIPQGKLINQGSPVGYYQSQIDLGKKKLNFSPI